MVTSGPGGGTLQNGDVMTSEPRVGTLRNGSEFGYYKVRVSRSFVSPRVWCARPLVGKLIMVRTQVSVVVSFTSEG